MTAPAKVILAVLALVILFAVECQIYTAGEIDATAQCIVRMK